MQMYHKVVDKLKLVINHKPNGKIVSIEPLEQEKYQPWHEGPRTILKYDDGEFFEISCDSIEDEIINWYFKIDEYKTSIFLDDKFYINPE